MKTPPKQYTDSEARDLTERFIKKYRKKTNAREAQSKKGKNKK
jgi:hypothetical protein